MPLNNSLSMINAAFERHTFLPEIPLPSFHGEYKEWPAFKNMFESRVHQDDKLTNIKKFHYSRSCLKGEAFELVQEVEMSNGAYVFAYELLEKRYSNTRRNILGHVRSIISFPRVNGSASILRKLHNNISTRLQLLKALKEPIHTWDTLLIGIIMSKMDEGSLNSWEQSLKSPDMPKYKKLNAFLEARCNALEAAEENNQLSSGITPNKNTNVQRKCLIAESITQQPQSKGIDNVNSSQRGCCPLCKRSHKIYACETFLGKGPEERYRSITELHLYYNCLSSNHGVKSFKGQGCKRCNKKHNSLLHHPNPHKVKPSSISTAEEKEVTQRKEENQLPQLVNCSLSHQAQILLATTKVIVMNNQNEPHTYRAVLHSGSQINIITNKI